MAKRRNVRRTRTTGNLVTLLKPLIAPAMWKQFIGIIGSATNLELARLVMVGDTLPVMMEAGIVGQTVVDAPRTTPTTIRTRTTTRRRGRRAKVNGTIPVVQARSGRRRTAAQPVLQH